MSDLLIEIEELLNSGLTVEQIAEKLNISQNMIETAVEMLEQDLL